MKFKFSPVNTLPWVVFTLLMAVPLPQACGQSDCVSAAPGLTGWWRGENSTTNFTGIGAGDPGAGMAYATGLVGKGFLFNGHNFLEIPASPATDVGVGDGMTMEAWIEVGDSIARPLVDWSPNGAFGSHIWINHPAPGGVYVNLFDTAGQHHFLGGSSTGLTTNTFAHVAVTYDKITGLGRIFVNGSIVGEAVLGVFTPQTGHNMCLGYRLPGAPFGVANFLGIIDEFTLYNRALGTLQIQRIFAGGAAGKCATVIMGPPSILHHPESQTANFGDDVSLVVVAGGASPLNYQWAHNGVDIPGKTDDVLHLTNVEEPDGGNYSVLVTNGEGSVASSNAVLNVLSSVGCSPVPGGNVGWWRGEGSGFDAFGTNNAVFVGNLPFVGGRVGDAFNYSSDGGYLKVPASPSLNIGLGEGLTLEAWIKPESSPVGIPIFEWSSTGKYGVHMYANIPSVGCLYGTICEANGNLHILQSSPSALSINKFQHVAMTYQKRTGMARLLVNGLVVLERRVGSVTPKTDTDLTIGYRLPGAPLGACYFQGLIDEAAVYDRGLETNELRSIYLAGMAGKCVPIYTPPVIVSEPTSRTVGAGATTIFSVSATSSTPLSYQWTYNSAAIDGQTQPTITLSNVQMANVGDYAVVVSGPGGSVTSAVARLEVLRGATLSPVVSFGFVVGATIIEAGYGYTNTPLVRIVGGGGSGAQGVVTLTDGVVTGITIVNAGSGYTGVPRMIVQLPFIPSPVLTATPMTLLLCNDLAPGGTYQLQRKVAWYWSNTLTSFLATGSSYSQTLDGVAGETDYRLVLSPTPSQAFAVPQMVNGFVVGVTVSAGGSGYFSAPGVVIYGGGGSNAAAVASVTGGVVSGLALTSAGIGYTSTPSIRIDPPPAAAVTPAKVAVIRLKSGNLSPYDAYRFESTPAIGRKWDDVGDVIIPTEVTNTTDIRVTNSVGLFRMKSSQ